MTKSFVGGGASRGSTSAGRAKGKLPSIGRGLPLVAFNEIFREVLERTRSEALEGGDR